MSQEEYLRDRDESYRRYRGPTNIEIENLENKVKSLEEEVRHLQWEKDYLAKQVEHLQSCLDLEKNKD